MTPAGAPGKVSVLLFKTPRPFAAREILKTIFFQDPPRVRVEGRAFANWARVTFSISAGYFEQRGQQGRGYPIRDEIGQ